MNGQPDVVVVGGGLVGTLVAWELAQRHLAVTVVDGARGGAASQAAAGMLTPTAEADGPDPLWEFLRRGLARTLEVVPRLEAESGLAVGLRRCGVLQVSASPAGLDLLRARWQWQAAADPSICWVDQRDLRELEPALHPGLLGGVFAPGEGELDAARYLAAARRAAARRGVRFADDTLVWALKTRGERVVGVETSAGPVTAGATVVAAGAWSSFLLPPTREPVGPVRGQLAVLGDSRGLIRRVIFGEGGYLAPKASGELWVGATEDASGFDFRVTAGGMAAILATAQRLAPAVAELPFLRGQAGLRPKIDDARPRLGPWPGRPGLWVAIGHYRNGVLLAAETGRLLAACIAAGEGATGGGWEAFAVDRGQG